MVDSTANLVWANAVYIELPLYRLSAGQPYVQENDPVSGHRKFELSPVFSRPGFRCFFEHGRHPRVRHLCLDGDTRSGNRSCGRIGQLEDDRSRANLGRLGRDRVLNRNYRGRIATPGAPGPGQRRHTEEEQNAKSDVGRSPHARLHTN